MRRNRKQHLPQSGTRGDASKGKEWVAIAEKLEAEEEASKLDK
jgi:hypothetical protein